MNTKYLSKISRNFLAIALSFAFYGLGFAIAPPSQVTNVKAELVGENSVRLTWDEATSEEGIITGYRVYYGTKPVSTEDDVYEEDISVLGDRTSYPITDLDYGKTYYFAVTAEDDELNQSLNYSEEVSVEIPAKKEEVVATEDPVDKPEEVVTEQPKQEDPPVEEPKSEPVQQEVVQEEKPAAPVEIDITAPAEIKNLFIDKADLKNKNIVTIRWQKSADLDGDVADQIFYVKKGNANWDKGYSIGKDLEEMVFDVQKNKNYQIKIVTVDKAGNRSQGVTKTFSTEILATSGPGMIIPFAIVAIAIFFFLSFRRRS